jgi:hypothetical protein
MLLRLFLLLLLLNIVLCLHGVAAVTSRDVLAERLADGEGGTTDTHVRPLARVGPDVLLQIARIPAGIVAALEAAHERSLACVGPKVRPELTG